MGNGSVNSWYAFKIYIIFLPWYMICISYKVNIVAVASLTSQNILAPYIILTVLGMDSP